MLTGARLHDEINQINLEYEARLVEDLEAVESTLTDPIHYLNLFFSEIPGDRVLDAGCGAGRYVSDFIEAGMEYVGVDYSPDMVRVASARNPDEDFRVLDFEALVSEFGKDAFDGIWACCVFGGMARARLPGKLAQMYEVLKPGGIALMIIPFSYESGEKVCDTPYGPMYYSSWDAAEFASHLENAGFRLGNPAIDFRSGCVMYLVVK